MEIEKYFEGLKAKIELEYEVANKARSFGFDPVKKVEIPLALTLAEKAVNLIKSIYPNLNVKKISERILELEEKYGQLETTVAFVIAREIAEEKFCKFSDKMEAIDCGIRVGFSYMTLGVVASPLEGYTGLLVKKTKDGKEYLAAKFSGPIRSAGTTASCLVLVLIDYLRQVFCFAKYDATEDEINRYFQESLDYHERVSNLQYFPTEEEMRFLVSNLPIQLDGDPTEKKEVSNYKDLERVDTNFIRGGMCLILNEGLAQKAGKALGRLRRVKENGLEIKDWDWLEGYVNLHKKQIRGNDDLAATYIKDLVAGRPVYGHPGKSGGFRFRYGRGRTSGFSAVSIHPATMGISNGFLSNGTQLKIEKPTKGCIITSCDSIDGPIVKLKNGTVKRPKTYEEAKELYKDLDEIVYLGDILFPFGDVYDRNANLVKPGYVEEWWELESGTSSDIDFKQAVEVSKKKKVALNPRFIFYWTQISNEQLFGLIDLLNLGVWTAGKLVLPWENSVRDKFSLGKRALELLGVEHAVHMDNVIIDSDAEAFLFNLGVEDLYNGQNLEFKINRVDSRSVLEIVNDFCSVEIKDKAGDFIGARMGRPEKAKLRKLTGSPNVLFPLGDQGGRLRSVQEAVNNGFVKADFPLRKCECGNETIYDVCEVCGKETKKEFYCKSCREIKQEKCKLHDNCFDFQNRKLDIKKYFNSAVERLGFEDFEIPPMIKGIKDSVNNGKIPENLAKGVLRAKFGLSVNKDGTIRYDGTEIPITHFKPIEIKVGIEKLKSLGYDKDICGEDLIDENQILELKPHDIILPSCPDATDERADDVFLNISKFLDEELEKFYKMEPFYCLDSRAGLIGQLVVLMAPHNCAGVVGRIIGFGQMQGVMASPYMHAAMRRDCDGDECAVMMLMDVLINFSREFLPTHRGSSQDAPLVLNARIRAGEVDDQILSFETCDKYPLNLYKLAERRAHSSEVDVELVRDRLKMGDENPFVGAGFTHDTGNFNFGNNNGAYKVLPSMMEKVWAQMDLVEKIRAVETDDVARLILERHFIRDIIGNLRKFSKQQFRCSKCGEKYRRIPLCGYCRKCGGKIIFTVSEGSIKKYLEPAKELARRYNISSYTLEGMELMNDYIETIFGKESVDSSLDKY